MPEIILFLVVFFGTYLGVRYFREWSLKKNLLDVPNERSSHTTPTPRGGGLIIILVCLSAYLVFSKITGRQFSTVYIGGAFLIGLISWLDDLFTISFVWRFLIHSLAAVLVIFYVGHFRVFDLPSGGYTTLNIGGAVLTFVWIVWLTNAFNFMDGIDGLAGIQAVAAGLGWLTVGNYFGFDQKASVLGGILAFSSFGFLLQNWSPARIFMGDVGSAFLGFSFAVLPLLAINKETADSETSTHLPLIGAAMVWLFLFDTVTTFLQRVLRGEKVWRAHREHIYQKLVISGRTHGSVSLLYGTICALTIVLIIIIKWRTENYQNVLISFLVVQSVFLMSVLYISNRKANRNL